MAKTKGGKFMSDSVVWSLTVLTLAIACATMAMLISENQDLKTENAALVSAARY